jgi:hypothetical protein
MGDLPTPRAVGLFREKHIADSLRQIEESRRLIEQSKTLTATGAKQIARSEESIADTQRLLAIVNEALKARAAGMLS